MRGYNVTVLTSPKYLPSGFKVNLWNMEGRQACRAIFKARRKSSFWAQEHGLGPCLPLLLMNSGKLLPPFSYLMARAKELIMHLNSTCYPV